MEQKLVLFLMGIDYLQLNQDYKSGNARHIGIPKTKLKLKSNKTITGTLPGTSTDDNTFITLIKGEKRVCVTSNCEEFKGFTEDQKQSGFCHYCLMKIEGEYCGIPLDKLSKEEQTILTEFRNCSLNCALAELWRRNPEHWRMSDFKYDKSENILRQIHDKLYPGKILYPSQDYKLLTVFGGSLSYDQYHNKNSVYTPLSGVFLQPVKSVYVKIKSQ